MGGSLTYQHKYLPAWQYILTYLLTYVLTLLYLLYLIRCDPEKNIDKPPGILLQGMRYILPGLRTSFRFGMFSYIPFVNDCTVIQTLPVWKEPQRRPEANKSSCRRFDDDHNLASVDDPESNLYFAIRLYCHESLKAATVQS